MRKVCSVILLALLAVLPVSYARAAAPGGDDPVLAGGQPPLTQSMVDQLVDLFGWAFDAQFSAAEREQFARQLIRQWQGGDRSAVESAQGLLKLRERVLAAPEDERAALRQQVQPAMLAELRKIPDDETARLLLGVYERAHRASGQSTLDTPSGGPVAGGGPVKAGRADDPLAPKVYPRESRGDASEVVGEWSQSEVSTVDYANPNTGAHADPSGERLNIRLNADGTYKIGWLLQSALYGCTSSVFGYKTGVYSVEGSTITFTDRTNTLTSKDNCHAEWNYEKHPPLGKSTYQWELGQTKYGPGLILLGTDGKRRAYVRETGKGLLGN